ncbi:shikimate dehydrogenase, partial [Amycolatopsis sp. NPDC000740]
LLGAGGAGAAAAHALLTLGAESLAVLDTDTTRAVRLADDLAMRFGPGRVWAGRGLERELSEAGGLVHATPVGLAGHPGLPLPMSLLRKELWVAEIVYRPLETALLRAARALGCRTLDGGPMAVHQAAAALKLFCGREPDPARMLRHLTELVSAETPGGTSRVA